MITGSTTFREIVYSIVDFINLRVIPVLVLLAIVVFFYNLVYYLRNMSNEKEREQFKKYTVNALIGLFVILSFWGIVSIATNTFFSQNPILPQLPTSGN